MTISAKSCLNLTPYVLRSIICNFSNNAFWSLQNQTDHWMVDLPTGVKSWFMEVHEFLYVILI